MLGPSPISPSGPSGAAPPADRRPDDRAPAFGGPRPSGAIAIPRRRRPDIERWRLVENNLLPLVVLTAAVGLVWPTVGIGLSGAVTPLLALLILAVKPHVRCGNAAGRAPAPAAAGARHGPRVRADERRRVPHRHGDVRRRTAVARRRPRRHAAHGRVVASPGVDRTRRRRARDRVQRRQHRRGADPRPRTLPPLHRRGPGRAGDRLVSRAGGHRAGPERRRRRRPHPLAGTGGACRAGPVGDRIAHLPRPAARRGRPQRRRHRRPASDDGGRRRCGARPQHDGVRHRRGGGSPRRRTTRSGRAAVHGQQEGVLDRGVRGPRQRAAARDRDPRRRLRRRPDDHLPRRRSCRRQPGTAEPDTWRSIQIGSEAVDHRADGGDRAVSTRRRSRHHTRTQRRPGRPW
jgi:hypothetical protein